MARQKFEFRDDVVATWGILDRLAKMVWEHDDVPQETRKRINDAVSKLHGELVSASTHLPNREVTRRKIAPRGADLDTGPGQNGFKAFTTDRIAKLTFSRDIETLADAFVKGTAALEVIGNTVGNGTGGFLFRGQRNIEWSLVPKLGRSMGFQEFLRANGEDAFLQAGKSMVSDYERKLLSEFRNNWQDLEDVDPIDQMIELTDNDPSWWFRMQHYDDGSDGTRLLDVTSSIPAALLFACLDWETGLVDDSTDGVVYLFCEGMNSVVHDFSLVNATTLEDELFYGFHEVAPVQVLNPPHNERSKAQAGSFVWWPKFWEPYPGQIFYLRVPKENKRTIVKELLRTNFGPKDIVRGEKGRANELNLRVQLDM